MRTADASVLLFGRDAELDVLVSGIRGAAAGAGRAIVVEGEGGIGKTSLLDAALRRAAPARVFRAAASELEGRRPFGAIADCLGIHRRTSDPQRRAILNLLLGEVPAHVSLVHLGDGPPMEFRLVEEMLGLVDALCRDGPVVLAVEDVHWADPSTILVLHRLGRELEYLPLLLVVTCRPRPRRPELAQLLESLTAAGADRLVLAPLDAESSVAVAAALIGAPPGPTLLPRIVGVGGNPLYIGQLVGGLQRQGSLMVTAAGTAETTAVRVPPTLTSAILHRLSFLPPSSLDVLRAASVLGRSFAAAELANLVGRPVSDLMPALQECVAQGVLDEARSGLAFRHDLLREALYDELPESVRSALHMQAAWQLAGSGAAADRVAEHLMRGASRGDAQAVDWLWRAARDAAPRAPALSVELLARALALVDASSPQRDAMLADQAMSLTWSGRFRDGEAVCRSALARGDAPDVELAFRMCLVQALLGSGRVTEALEETDAARVSPGLSDADHARFAAWAGICHMLLGELERAAELAETAWSRATELGDPLTCCIALGTLATVGYFRGRFEEALQVAEEAYRVAEASPDRHGHRFPISLFLGVILMMLDRVDEGKAALRRGRRITEQLGGKGQVPAFHWALALGDFWSGDWDDAIAECRVSAELGGELGMGQGILFSHSLRSLIHLHRDEVAAAEEAVAAAEREFACTGPQFGVPWMMWARALVLEAQTDVDGAYAVLSNAWDMCTNAELRSEFAAIGPDLVRMAVAAGDDTRAEHVVALLEALAARAGVASVHGAARRCRGLLHADPTSLLDAVAAYRRTPRVFDLATACEDAAAQLRVDGGPEAAAPLFDEACALYGTLGAARDLARAERRRGRGARRHAVPDVGSGGWDVLSETEAAVVGLVAAGRSDGEIAERLSLTRRTVGIHVASAIGKLGIGSRRELAAEAERYGVPRS